ncbi:efflux RND transporter periplasmic adaptor subunit [Micromonospora sp. NPDC050397]|uniref:efflux RND transporter periplasmic adaptor subunit n=1 Tax=Micromonospora sp. NPDC050397 TaxID=3364279 RepID=UPI0038514D97
MGIGLGASGRAARGRRMWWLSGGVAVVLVLSGSVTAYALTGDRAEPPSPAATARVDRGDVTLEIATTGNLRPAQTRSLGFAGGGTVSEVRVRAGDQVSAGQLLARIDPADAQRRVDSARDALTEARTALDAARQRQSRPPTTGCDGGVGTGGTAGGSGGSTGGTVQPGRSGSPSASASGSPTASASGSPTASAGRPGAGTPDGSAQSTGGGRTCSGAGASGAAGGTDPVLRAQQRVTGAELDLAEATDVLTGASITAPIAGRVLSVSGGVGTKVGGGATFVTLGDVAGMEVAASWPEADAGRLAVGLAATITLASRPGEEFTARVTQVDPVGTADGALVRYGALLGFDRVPADALVGQSANARVTVRSVAGVLRVPVTAVHLPAASTSGQGAEGATGPSDGQVRVRTPGGGTEPRQVTFGVRGDRYVEIVGGLDEGEEVLLDR